MPGTAKLVLKLVPFAGYEMPIQYSSIVAEHQACRTSAALFDVSHMGRLRFDGEGSESLLDHLLSRRVSDLPIGGVRYGLICNAEGGVLDDVLVSHLETPSQQRYHLMVVNASNREKILNWLTPHLADFPKVTVSDRTELTAMIAVQGPRAMEVCKRLFRFDPSRLKYYRAAGDRAVFQAGDRESNWLHRRRWFRVDRASRGGNPRLGESVVGGARRRLPGGGTWGRDTLAAGGGYATVRA